MPQLFYNIVFSSLCSVDYRMLVSIQNQIGIVYFRLLDYGMTSIHTFYYYANRKSYTLKKNTPIGRLQQHCGILLTAATGNITTVCVFRQTCNTLLFSHMVAKISSLKTLLKITTLPTPRSTCVTVNWWPFASLFWWPAELWESDTVGYNPSSSVMIYTHREPWNYHSLYLFLNTFKLKSKQCWIVIMWHWNICYTASSYCNRTFYSSVSS